MKKANTQKSRDTVPLITTMQLILLRSKPINCSFGD